MYLKNIRLLQRKTMNQKSLVLIMQSAIRESSEFVFSFLGKKCGEQFNRTGVQYTNTTIHCAVSCRKDGLVCADPTPVLFCSPDTICEICSRAQACSHFPFFPQVPQFQAANFLFDGRSKNSHRMIKKSSGLRSNALESTCSKQTNLIIFIVNWVENLIK